MENWARWTQTSGNPKSHKWIEKIKNILKPKTKATNITVSRSSKAKGVLITNLSNPNS